jgi:hypothetical protein
MRVAGGLLEGQSAVLYSNDTKQKPSLYPYLAMDWVGTRDIDWVVAAGNPRIAGSGRVVMEIGELRIALAMFARGKTTLEDADKALQDLVFKRVASGRDTGLIPAVADLASAAVVDEFGGRWVVMPEGEVYSARVDAKVHGPFCVGAGIILRLNSKVEIKRS